MIEKKELKRWYYEFKRLFKSSDQKIHGQDFSPFLSFAFKILTGNITYHSLEKKISPNKIASQLLTLIENELKETGTFFIFHITDKVECGIVRDCCGYLFFDKNNRPYRRKIKDFLEELEFDLSFIYDCGFYYVKFAAGEMLPLEQAIPTYLINHD
jgi:hypothetical protein